LFEPSNFEEERGRSVSIFFFFFFFFLFSATFGVPLDVDMLLPLNEGTSIVIIGVPLPELTFPPSIVRARFENGDWELLNSETVANCIRDSAVKHLEMDLCWGSDQFVDTNKTLTEDVLNGKSILIEK
jgi:hypothetical protein